MKYKTKTGFGANLLARWHRDDSIFVKLFVSGLSLLMVLPVVTQANCTLVGTGTSNDPYQIGSYSDLEQLSSSTSCDLTASYRLVSDIDASSSSSENNGHGFAPIGDSLGVSGFSGVFHGGGHTIRNLVILDSTDSYVGLFGLLATGSLLDSLNIQKATIRGSFFNNGDLSEVGSVAGENDGSIRQVRITDLSVLGDSGAAVGGLVGGNFSAISQSGGTANVTGTGFQPDVGGIAGYSEGSIDSCSWSGTDSSSTEGSIGGIVGGSYGTLGNCQAAGRVWGDTGSNVGGVVGDNENVRASGGSIRLCEATDTVEGTVGSIVGGLVGLNGDSAGIGRSYAAGRIVADSGSTVGGLVGYNEGPILNSYAAGVLSVADSSDVGGLVGENGYLSLGSIQISYAADSIHCSHPKSLGGLVGSLDQSGTLEYIYWDTQTAGVAHGIGSIVNSAIDTSTVLGYTSSQMRDMTNFVGFDFSTESAWTSESNSFPLLRGISNAPSVEGTTTRIIAKAKAEAISGPSLRWAGRDAYLELRAPALVQVVDLTGRQVVPETPFAIGSSRLSLPRGSSMLFVQLRSGSRTTTLPLAPLR